MTVTLIEGWAAYRAMALLLNFCLLEKVVKEQQSGRGDEHAEDGHGHAKGNAALLKFAINISGDD